MRVPEAQEGEIKRINQKSNGMMTPHLGGAAKNLIQGGAKTLLFWTRIEPEGIIWRIFILIFSAPSFCEGPRGPGR